MTAPVPKVCSECGQPKWQKHLETCPGPPKRACECPPGFRHQKGCYEAYWPDDEGDEAA